MAETGWQPIETAPKDGDFLAYTGTGYITRARYLSGKFFAPDTFGPISPHDARDPSLTHWQPLPEPPK